MFALLGAAVLLRRPDLSSARWFGAFSAAAAMALAVGPASAGSQPLWALVVQIVMLAGVGATCLPFIVALVASQRKSRLFGIPSLLIVVGIVILAGYAASVLFRPALYELVRPALFLYMAITMVGAIGLLALASVRQQSQIRVQQARIALSGIGLGTLPLITLTLVPEAFVEELLVPAHVSVLAVGLIPVAFAYAILQHNLLGIRRLVHRGMVYGLTTLATFAVIAAALSAATSLLPETVDNRVPLALTALLLTAGVALFMPLRHVVRWLVDKLLYDDVVQYEAFAEVVHGNLVTSGPANEVITGIARRLVEALRLESAVLFLGRDPSDLQIVTAEGPRTEDVLRDVYPRLQPTILAAEAQDLMDLRWESDSLLVMNLKSSGRRIGFALLGPKLDGEVFVEDEKRLAATVAPLLALSVDQSILSGELRELNQRLVRAQENERARVAVDIHDGPLQKAILLTRAEGAISEDRRGLSRELVAELREISSRLRPSILDDLGLVPAIEWLLDGLSSRSELATGLSLHGVDEDDRLHAATELALFRVTQEAINNVVKHADATRLDVSLSREGGVLVLKVADDGIGISPTLHNNGGVGLSGMRERVIHVDGTFEASSAPGAGTTVIARVPSDKRIPLGDRR